MRTSRRLALNRRLATIKGKGCIGKVYRRLNSSDDMEEELEEEDETPEEEPCQEGEHRNEEGVCVPLMVWLESVPVNL